MPKQHTEYTFETAIEHQLTTAGGYEKGDRIGFDAERVLFIVDLIAFIRKTQPRKSSRLWPNGGINPISVFLPSRQHLK